MGTIFGFLLQFYITYFNFYLLNSKLIENDFSLIYAHVFTLDTFITILLQKC